MKNLNKQIVRDVAERLMVNFNKTTTLEIKLELRNLGYKANQAEVSGFVMDLSDELGWRWSNAVNTENMVYRLYSLPDGYVPNYSKEDELEVIEDENTDVELDPIVQTDYISRNGDVISTTPIDFVTKGDWKVYSGLNTTVLYFAGWYTRDEVRCAYSSICNVIFWDTRSKRVK